MRKATLDEMKAIALSRGGRCLSRSYVNNTTKLLWSCSGGHRFEATSNNVKNHGSWCLICSSPIGEQMVRALFESAFGTEFSKARPPWLRNARGNQMELDGFAPDLKLAFEYQGRQHNEAGWWKNAKEHLETRKADDRLKKELCKSHGITLVCVPEVQGRMDVAGFKSAIIAVSPDLKERLEGVSVNLKAVYTSRQGRLSDEFSSIAASRGGEVLGTYVCNKTKVLVRCANGHEWGVRPNDVKSGYWCRTCSGTAPLTIGEMRNIAKARGGRCLSLEYKNLNSKLSWRCAAGHVWQAVANSLRNMESWCPKCAGKAPLDIQIMKEMAAKRGGECLSSEYVNNHTPLSWKCAEGHTWMARAGNVRMGTWCPTCSIKGRG